LERGGLPPLFELNAITKTYWRSIAAPQVRKINVAAGF